MPFNMPIPSSSIASYHGHHPMMVCHRRDHQGLGLYVAICLELGRPSAEGPAGASAAAEPGSALGVSAAGLDAGGVGGWVLLDVA